MSPTQLRGASPVASDVAILAVAKPPAMPKPIASGPRGARFFRLSLKPENTSFKVFVTCCINSSLVLFKSSDTLGVSIICPVLLSRSDKMIDLVFLEASIFLVSFVEKKISGKSCSLINRQEMRSLKSTWIRSFKVTFCCSFLVS